MDKEIKFSNSSEEIRRYVLNEINKLDCWVVWGAITKKNAISQLRKNSAYLYNYLCGLVLCDMFERTHTKKINLILTDIPPRREIAINWIHTLTKN